jgi:hypothetical protein
MDEARKDVEGTSLTRILQSRTAAAREEIRKGPSPVIDWGYGVDTEGIYVQPTGTSAQVLVVGAAIPWWGMVISRLNLRIHSILLHDLRLCALVSAYFGASVPVRGLSQDARSDISETLSALGQCTVVALEKLPRPRDSLWERMWFCPSIRLILVAHGQLTDPPMGWELWRRPVSHREAGGVTNLSIHLGVYYRSRVEKVTIDPSCHKIVLPRSKTRSNQPNRDLRSVLKVAIQGRSCRAPGHKHGQEGSPHEVGTKVIEARPGVVESAGLLRVELSAGRVRLLRVRTWFGGNVWVIRSLTLSELVSAWDVPEKLGKLVGSDEG